MRDYLRRLANNIKSASLTPTAIGFSYWALVNILFVNDYSAAKLAQGKSSLEVLAIYKTGALLLAILISNFIASQIRKAKKNALYRKYLKRSLIYFAIAFALLLLVWPGLYTNDDTLELMHAANLTPTAWQSYITHIFISLSIKLLPIASAPIILQCIIAAFITGYVSTFLPIVITRAKKRQRIISIVIFCIFFLPPVLFYLLTAYRAAVYQFLEVFLLSYYYIHYKKSQKSTPLARLGLLLVAILLCSWRTEGIYYLIGIPILLLITGKKLISTKQVLIYTAAIAIAVFSLSNISKAIMKNRSYTLSALMVPTAGIIEGALQENDAETLDAYSGAINTQCVKNNNYSSNPEKVFWGCTNMYADDDKIDNAINVTIKATPKYLKNIVPGYLDIFCDAFLGLKCGPWNTGSTSISGTSFWTIYNFSDSIQKDDEIATFEHRIDLPLDTIHSRKLRTAVINILSGHTLTATHDREEISHLYDYQTYSIPVIHQIFFSLLIPTVLLIASLIKTVKSKKTILIIILLLVAARAPIVLAGSMASFLMYFMPYYISSLVFFVVALFEQPPKKKAAPKKATAKKKK